MNEIASGEQANTTHSPSRLSLYSTVFIFIFEFKNRLIITKAHWHYNNKEEAQWAEN
jgi:hypothetical protein